MQPNLFDRKWVALIPIALALTLGDAAKAEAGGFLSGFDSGKKLGDYLAAVLDPQDRCRKCLTECVGPEKGHEERELYCLHETCATPCERVIEIGNCSDVDCMLKVILKYAPTAGPVKTAPSLPDPSEPGFGDVDPESNPGDLPPGYQAPP